MNMFVFLSGKLSSLAEGGRLSGILNKKTTEKTDHFVDVTAYMQVFSDTGQVVPIEVHHYTAFLTICLHHHSHTDSTKVRHINSIG